MTLPAPVEFTDHDIQLIIKALPDGYDPLGFKLLPCILRDWADNDLRYHLAAETAALRKKRRERWIGFGKAAGNLLQKLSCLDRRDRLQLLEQLAITEGSPRAEAILTVDERSFSAICGIIATLSAAAEVLSKPGRGRPRMIRSMLIMRDLAAIFEFVACIPAVRIVDRITGEECGPFYRFAKAVWPVILGTGDTGLPSAIKTWAATQKRYPEEVSPVIANVALRHPGWGM